MSNTKEQNIFNWCYEFLDDDLKILFPQNKNNQQTPYKKTLLIYGQDGIGKSTIIKSLSPFKIKELTNEDLDDLTRKQSTDKKEECTKINIKKLFLDYFNTYDDDIPYFYVDIKDSVKFNNIISNNRIKYLNNKNVISIDKDHQRIACPKNKKLIFINENTIYNFISYKKVIKLIIELNDRYPIIISINESQTKLLNTLKTKTTQLNISSYYSYAEKIIRCFLSNNNIVDYTTTINNSTIFKSFIENNYNGNLNKLKLLLNMVFVFVNADKRNKRRKNKLITDDIINEVNNNTIKYDIKQSIYASSNQLIMNYNNIQDAFNKFYNEITYVPLMVEDEAINRIKCCKTTPDYYITSELSKSFNYANLYDTYIFNYQKWNLTKYYGFFSCVYPSYLLNKDEIKHNILKYKPLNVFPTDINKTSTQKLNTKQLLIIYDKFNISNASYYILLHKYINFILTQFKNNDLNNKTLEDAREFFNTYNINDYSLLDKILKINKLSDNVKISRTEFKRLIK